MGPLQLRKKRRARPNRTKGKFRQEFQSKLATFTLKTVLQSYRLASFIKSVPFEVIESPKLRVKLFGSKWRTYLWYLSNAVLYAYGIFQAYRFPQVILSQGLTAEFVYHTGYIALFSVGILYIGFMFRDGSTYVGLINGFDSLLNWAEVEDWTRAKWNKSPFAAISVVYFALTVAAALPVFILLFVLFPTHSRFAFSILPAILQNRLEVILLGIVLEGLLTISCFCLVCNFNF